MVTKALQKFERPFRLQYKCRPFIWGRFVDFWLSVPQLLLLHNIWYKLFTISNPIMPCSCMTSFFCQVDDK